MTMTLPDITEDEYRRFQTEQFAADAQRQIDSHLFEATTAEQIATLPAPAAFAEPPPLPEPPPPEPAPSYPSPDAPLPETFGPPPPPSTPPPVAPPVAARSGGGPGEWFGQALSAVEQAGGDVAKFASRMNPGMPDFGQALGAAESAGADLTRFSGLLSPPPAPAARPPSPAATVSASRAPVAAGGDLREYARQAAQRSGIDPDLFEAQIQQESGFRPGAVSGAGAQGIAQIVPKFHPGVDPSDPYASLDYAANLMKGHLGKYQGDYSKALAAYNAGGGAVDKYGGVPPFEETQRYVQTILGNAKQAVGGAFDQAGAAVRGKLADISQFGDPKLTNDEAYAACGPAAAVNFAQRYGRNPTLREATDLAASVGWTSGQGMAGIASEKSLMDKLGVATKLVQGAQWNVFAKEAQSGNPVTISTAGHYFFADGYDPSSGAFHVGRSGTDLRQGSEWMTPQQMEGLMGAVQGALLADNPTVPAPSIADQDTNPAGWLDRARDTIGSSFGAAKQAVGDQLGFATDALGNVLNLAGQQITSPATRPSFMPPEPMGITGDSLPDVSDLLKAPPPGSALAKAIQSGIGTLDVREQLEALAEWRQGLGHAREQMVERLNPARDVPVLGGAINLGASSAIDPEQWLTGMGAGRVGARAAERLGGGLLGDVAKEAILGGALNADIASQVPGASVLDVGGALGLGAGLGAGGRLLGAGIGALGRRVGQPGQANIVGGASPRAAAAAARREARITENLAAGQAVPAEEQALYARVFEDMAAGHMPPPELAANIEMRPVTITSAKAGNLGQIVEQPYFVSSTGHAIPLPPLARGIMGTQANQAYTQAVSEFGGRRGFPLGRWVDAEGTPRVFDSPQEVVFMHDLDRQKASGQIGDWWQYKQQPAGALPELKYINTQPDKFGYGVYEPDFVVRDRAGKFTVVEAKDPKVIVESEEVGGQRANLTGPLGWHVLKKAIGVIPQLADHDVGYRIVGNSDAARIVAETGRGSTVGARLGSLPGIDWRDAPEFARRGLQGGEAPASGTVRERGNRIIDAINDTAAEARQVAAQLKAQHPEMSDEQRRQVLTRLVRNRLLPTSEIAADIPSGPGIVGRAHGQTRLIGAAVNAPAPAGLSQGAISMDQLAAQWPEGANILSRALGRGVKLGPLSMDYAHGAGDLEAAPRLFANLHGDPAGIDALATELGQTAGDLSRVSVAYVDSMGGHVARRLDIALPDAATEADLYRLSDLARRATGGAVDILPAINGDGTQASLHLISDSLPPEDVAVMSSRIKALLADQGVQSDEAPGTLRAIVKTYGGATSGYATERARARELLGETPLGGAFDADYPRGTGAGAGALGPGGAGDLGQGGRRAALREPAPGVRPSYADDAERIGTPDLPAGGLPGAGFLPRRGASTLGQAAEQALYGGVAGGYEASQQDDASPLDIAGGVGAGAAAALLRRASPLGRVRTGRLANAISRAADNVPESEARLWTPDVDRAANAISQIVNPSGELLSTTVARPGRLDLSAISRTLQGAEVLNPPSAQALRDMPNLMHMARDMPDVQASIQRIAEDNAEAIDKFRQGKVTHAETMATARELGMTAEDFLKTEIGKAFNPAELFALRAWAVQKKANVAELTQDMAARGVKNMSAEEQVAAAREMMDAAQMQLVAKGGSSTAGRVLNQQKMDIDRHIASLITGGNERKAAERGAKAAEARLKRIDEITERQQTLRTERQGAREAAQAGRTRKSSDAVWQKIDQAYEELDAYQAMSLHEKQTNYEAKLAERAEAAAARAERAANADDPQKLLKALEAELAAEHGHFEGTYSAMQKMQDEARLLELKGVDVKDFPGKVAAKQAGAELQGTRAWLKAQRDVAQKELDAANRAAEKQWDRESGEQLADQQTRERIAERVLERLGGKEITTAMLENLVKVMSSGDEMAAAKYLQSLQKTTWWDRIATLRYASMLSSSATHAAQLVSNTGQLGMALGTHPLAVGIDAARAGLGIGGKERTRYMGELPEMVRGIWGKGSGELEDMPFLARGAAGGIRQGARDARTILETGINPAEVSRNWERATRPGFASGSNLVDTAVEAPLRLLEAGDTLIRGGARGAFAHGLAARQAIREGLSGAERRAKIDDIVQNLHLNPELFAQADDAAKRVVLQEGRGEIRGLSRFGANAGADAGELAQSLVMPFVRTPYNVAAQGAGLTPAGYLAAIKALRNGNPGEFADRAARATLGTGILGGGYVAAANGYLTAGYPEDSGERSTLPDGWQPWSVRVPHGDGTHSYLRYSNIGPVGVPLALGASAHDALRHGRENDPGSVVAGMTKGFGRYMLDQSMLQGLSNIMDVVDDPEHKFENYAEGMATQFAPYAALARQLDRALGTGPRDPHGVLEALEATYPGLSSRVQPRLNALGQEVPETQTGLGQYASPFRYSRETPNSALAGLDDADVGIGAPPTTMTGLRLTPEERRQYQQLAGQYTEQWVNEMLADPDFQRRDADEKRIILRRVVEGARKAAQGDMVKAMPDADFYRRRDEEELRNAPRPGLY